VVAKSAWENLKLSAIIYSMDSLNAEGIQQKKKVENITQNKVVFWALDMFAVKTF
jgi:hypothetical protein